MSQKFSRNYRLTIDPRDGDPVIIVQPPFTVQFWMKRDVMASLNSLSIDVYNLSTANRRRIYQDAYNLQKNVVNGQPLGRRHVTFEVGYGNNLYKVFDGDIFGASSGREENNIVTRIECLSGIYDVASGQSNFTMAAGSTISQILMALVGSLPTLKIGAIGNFPTVMNRAVVLNGNTWELILTYSNGRAFIDNGKVYILNDNEVAQVVTVQVISAATGMLDTPRREQARLVVNTLLEASIGIGQLVTVNSIIEPTYNAFYKVLGIQHAGMISGAVSGNCRSVFILNAPNYYGNYISVKQS